jgi:phospho-N-acetylmuramoyl-pentapeptide-transferase
MFYHILYPLRGHVSFFNIFQYITFRTMYAAMTGFLIAYFFGPRAIRLMAEMQIGQYIRDCGPERHQQKAGTPTMGGILIILAGLGSSLLWADLTNRYVLIVIFSTLGFAAVGFVDDFRKTVKKRNKGLSGWAKFSLQCIMAVLVCLAILKVSGFNTRLLVPFLKSVRPDLGLVYPLFGMFVIVGASNAVNLTDGLDGLAAGPLIISYMGYMGFAYVAGNLIIAEYLQVAYVPGSGEVAVCCGAIAGALTGFLWFNTYPAEIFMGDVGSLPLGGTLGTVAVITRQEILLALVGGIFVVEALSVIFQVGYFKATGGKRIFRMAPLHHHFELKGLAEPKIIVRFWIIAVGLALIALSTLKIR